MPFFGDLFVSEVLKKTVLDSKGEELGRIKDIELVKGDLLPKVNALIIQKGKVQYKLPWIQLSIFNKKVIAAKAGLEPLESYAMNEGDLLASRDILDKQIVDANGVKVVRANDLKLEGYRDEALVVAVDVGMRGILRRLGFERGGEDLFKLFGARLGHNLISWNYIQPLQPKLETLALKVPRKMLSELHPADIAELLNNVSHDESTALIESLGVETAAETMMEMDLDVQTAILKGMDSEKASGIVEEMPPDVAADVLGRLSAEEAMEILNRMDKEDAEDIQELLGHEKDTAGGLMTTEFIAYPPGLSISEIIEKFRKDAEEMEAVYYVYAVEGEELVGAVSLRDLILAPPDALLSSIMETNLKTVGPEDEDIKVAEKISKYNLVVMPVVDETGNMLGVVTIDDIIDRLLPRRKRRRS
ncbi:MAG: CBS domain-containing protein [Nitrospiraceae bacterium]|nr:CBS domain-containing protein [Nitrospiraceae bacterium]